MGSVRSGPFPDGLPQCLGWWQQVRVQEQVARNREAWVLRTARRSGVHEGPQDWRWGPGRSPGWEHRVAPLPRHGSDSPQVSLEQAPREAGTHQGAKVQRSVDCPAEPARLLGMRKQALGISCAEPGGRGQDMSCAQQCKLPFWPCDQGRLPGGSGVHGLKDDSPGGEVVKGPRSRAGSAHREPRLPVPG